MPMMSMSMLMASFIHLSWLSSTTLFPSPLTNSSIFCQRGPTGRVSVPGALA